jgi:hypothetical protein
MHRLRHLLGRRPPSAGLPSASAGNCTTSSSSLLLPSASALSCRKPFQSVWNCVCAKSKAWPLAVRNNSTLPFDFLFVALAASGGMPSSILMGLNRPSSWPCFHTLRSSAFPRPVAIGHKAKTRLQMRGRKSRKGRSRDSNQIESKQENSEK